MVGTRWPAAETRALVARDQLQLDAAAGKAVMAAKRRSSGRAGAAIDERDRIIDRSPDGRFVCLNDVLGQGAYKTVRRGFDLEEGKEVAWCVTKGDSDRWRAHEPAAQAGREERGEGGSA